MGNRANVKPPFTFNQTSPAQLRGQVGDDDMMSDSASAVDANTMDVEGSQRGKKKRRTHPDAKETIDAFLDVFQNKWDDDKKTSASVREEEKDERQRIREDEKDEKRSILEVMRKTQESLSSVIDVLRVVVDKM